MAKVEEKPPERVQLSRPSFDALVGWGATLVRGGEAREALPFLRLAHAAFPDDAVAIKLLASCYHQTGFKRQASVLYRRALEQDPKQTDVLTNLAELLIGQLRYQEALDLLKKCMALDPDYKDSYAQRARALVMQVVDQLESR